MASGRAFGFHLQQRKRKGEMPRKIHKIQYSAIFKLLISEGRKMVPNLRALDTLPKDLVPIPNIHKVAYNHL